MTDQEPATLVRVPWKSVKGPFDELLKGLDESAQGVKNAEGTESFADIKGNALTTSTLIVMRNR